MESERKNLQVAELDPTLPTSSSGKNGLAAWLMEISRETAPLMNDGRTSKELMDELYDEETGLPK
jgi:hypothetical protein